MDFCHGNAKQHPLIIIGIYKIGMVIGRIKGGEEISNLDASGKKITDPQTCNRNYGNNFNYSVFCGYYLVKY